MGPCTQEGPTGSEGQAGSSSWMHWMHGRMMTSQSVGRTVRSADPLLACIASGRGWAGERRGFGTSQSVGGMGSQLGTDPSLGSVLCLGHQTELSPCSRAGCGGQHAKR